MIKLLFHPLTVDLGGEPESTDFEPLPEGRYSAVVVDFEQKESIDEGNPYINWEFEITDPDYTGRKVWSITTLLKGKMFKFIEIALALGLIASKKDRKKIKLDLSEIAGTPVELVLGVEDYLGDPKNRVKKVYAAGSEGMSPPRSSGSKSGSKSKSKTGNKAKTKSKGKVRKTSSKKRKF